MRAYKVVHIAIIADTLASYSKSFCTGCKPFVSYTLIGLNFWFIYRQQWLADHWLPLHIERSTILPRFVWKYGQRYLDWYLDWYISMVYLLAYSSCAFKNRFISPSHIRTLRHQSWIKWPEYKCSIRSGRCFEEHGRSSPAPAKQMRYSPTLERNFEGKATIGRSKFLRVLEPLGAKVWSEP